MVFKDVLLVKLATKKSTYRMKNALNFDLIDEVALKTDIEPAFIEKDWYAVQLLEVLKEFKNDQGLELVLSGGTSLSKGFGLIKRFSEDLDFFMRVQPNNS